MRGHIVASTDNAFDVKAATYAALPSASEHDAKVALVTTSTGTLLLGTRKLAGLYESTGGSWKYLGVNLAQVTTSEKEAATETAVRRFSPKDIADIAAGQRWVQEDSDVDGLDNPIYLLETRANNWRIRRISTTGAVATANTNLAKDAAWAQRQTLEYS